MTDQITNRRCGYMFTWIECSEPPELDDDDDEPERPIRRGRRLPPPHVQGPHNQSEA
jgi:hypothetical protein